MNYRCKHQLANAQCVVVWSLLMLSLWLVLKVFHCSFVHTFAGVSTRTNVSA